MESRIILVFCLWCTIYRLYRSGCSPMLGHRRRFVERGSLGSNCRAQETNCQKTARPSVENSHNYSPAVISKDNST